MAQPKAMCLAGARGTRFRPCPAILCCGLLVGMGLTGASCGSDDASAQAASLPAAIVTDQTRASDPGTGFVVTNDFSRVFYPRDSDAVVRIGRDNGVQRRAFVSATVMYQPPLTVEEIVHYVGGDPNPARDLVAMRCRPPDPSTLEAVLATWPHVFAALVADLGTAYTPADCPAQSSDAVDRQVYCAAVAFADRPETKVPLALANAITMGALAFELTGAPFQPTGSTTGADILFDVYGVGFGFSGLGFAVKDSFLAGHSVALTAGQALEQSVVPEYLLDNVTLAEGNCRCIRVKPYANRDQSPLNWDAVTAVGNQSLCTMLTKLP